MAGLSPAWPPVLLILNGPSSSGKSALLTALQEQYPGPLLDCGLDKFLWMLPGRYLNSALWQEIFQYEGRGTPEDPIRRIHVAEQGQRLVSGMHHAWRDLLQTGNHLAADHVLLEPAWREELARLLHGCRAYLIAVRCPLDVLEARERSRRDRTLGQARAQLPYVHVPDIYDFAVDTSRATPAQAADAVVRFLADAPQPFALRELRAATDQSRAVSP
jgi:chloramphenicol 3-O phosphotransferase